MSAGGGKPKARASSAAAAGFETPRHIPTAWNARNPPSTDAIMNAPMQLRAETDADHAAIDPLNRDAFRGDVEARLVNLLREAAVVIASLAAVDEAGEVVGRGACRPSRAVGDAT
jgi:hypothetical protein